jgi:acyl carrier protein
MDDATILSRLQVIFDDLFQDSRPTVTLELSAHDVDEWDSLMNVQLMVAAEQEFGISISAVDVENLQTVADLVRMIRAKLG